MKPEWQAKNLQKAFDKFIQMSNEEVFGQYDTSFDEMMSRDQLLVSVGFVSDNESLYVLIDSDRRVVAIEDVSDYISVVPQVTELLKTTLERTAGTILQEIIHLIGLYDTVPGELRVSFDIERNDDSKESIFHKTLEELLALDEQESFEPTLTAEFTTRWELVVDLFESLSQLELDIRIDKVPEDADVVQEYLAEQGVDFSNEHECFVFVMGMANLVEAMYTGYKEGDVPRDELISALARMLGILALIRPFLPQEIFTRFLM